MMPARLREVLANSVAGSALWSPRMRVRILRMAGATIGPGTRIRPYLRFIGRVDLMSIGRGCFVNMDVLIGSNAPVVLGDRVSVGPRVQFVPTSHEIGPSDARAGASISSAIEVGDGSWIGAGAIVLGGVRIGPGCVVAAGAVVTTDCERDGLYAGVPARRIRSLEPAPLRKEHDAAA